MTYVNPKEKVFSHLDRLAAWRAGAALSPVSLEVDLSARCSLGCQSCHQAHTHSRGPWVQGRVLRVLPQGFDAIGDLADVDVTFRWQAEARAAGVQSLIYSGGGEPTLHPHWAEIVDHGAALGFEQGMYTLGGHLDQESGRYLAERLTWAVVSLDCVDRRTYAREKAVPPARFDAACDGVRALVGHGAIVGVSFLLHHDNWGKAYDMLALARSLGADYATFRPTVEVSQAQPGTLLGRRQWALEALSGLELLARECDVELDPERFAEWASWKGHGYDTCYGIRLNATITPDARVWVCVNRRGLEDSCLGDLRTESFEQIWSRHPGQWTVDRQCRAMCRLHPVNQTLDAVYAHREHEAFI
jgi:MoaA/NifB/PqqE/SkfB family radical SAM enzyme